MSETITVLGEDFAEFTDVPGNLRVNNGALEWRVTVRKYKGAELMAYYQKWEPVPIVSEPQPPKDE